MKNILMTGARSGISSSVLEKIKNKYNIYITVHTDKQCEIISKKYSKYKNIKCYKLDITNELDRKKILNLDIDILISFAAIGMGGSISEIPMQKVRDNFEVNVFSNFEIMQIVIKNMIKKDSGKIILVSSMASILPIPFLGSYCATKSSISMLTHVLRKEMKLISNNIKIVLIEPGMYHTGFNQIMLDNKYDWMEIESYFKKIIEQIRNKENFLFGILEKQKLDSISNKIVKAVTKKHPKSIYRAPFFQAIGAKIYQIFKT